MRRAKTPSGGGKVRVLYGSSSDDSLSDAAAAAASVASRSASMAHSSPLASAYVGLADSHLLVGAYNPGPDTVRSEEMEGAQQPT